MPEVFTVDQDATERLDQWLVHHAALSSRSAARRLIDDAFVLVNGRTAKPSYRPRAGDRIQVVVPPPEDPEPKAEHIPLDVVYEDEHVLVLNKPQGMVVHPAPGHSGGTLVNALLAYCGALPGIGGVRRPGIVHRLDKDTSGLMVVAKSERAHHFLVQQLKERTVIREYLALVHGRLRRRTGVIDAPIARHPVDRKRMAVVDGGRSAITHYVVLESYGRPFSLLRCRLETGRTHQIRVHLAHLGHPVVGDPVYGSQKAPWTLAGQLLHACRLAFRHPVDHGPRCFTAPPPEPFASILVQLRADLPIDKQADGQ